METTVAVAIPANTAHPTGVDAPAATVVERIADVTPAEVVPVKVSSAVFFTATSHNSFIMKFGSKLSKSKIKEQHM